MSLSNFNIFEEIKQRTDCIDLARELGFNVNGSGMINCPELGHEDRNPSCKVYPDAFYCYGCGKRWSAIDMVMQVKGWDLLTAARWLADRAGIPWPEQNEEARQEYENQLNRQAELQKRIIAWARNLRPEDIEYLKGRGFTEEFIKEQGFGYCNQKMPQDPEAARELGLLITTKDGRDWYMPGGRLTAPFYQYGKVVQVAFHKPGEEPKYLYPVGWNKPLIANVSLVRHKGPVYLAEGVFDFFSLVSVGLPAATGLGTKLSGNQKQEVAKFSDLVILFDNDPSGKAAAQEMAKEFFPAARCPADVFELPTGKDLNDLLQEHDLKSFKKMVEEHGMTAKNYLDLLLLYLEGNTDTAARGEAVALIAKIESNIERESAISKLKRVTGIGKTAIRNDVDKIRKEAGEESKKEPDDGPIQHTAQFPSLVDIVESEEGEPVFLVLNNGEFAETTEYINPDGEKFYPPKREAIPFLLAKVAVVREHYPKDTDAALFADLVKHFQGVSELPGPNYYKLMAWWVMHTYIHRKAEYSPYIWFFAIPERGKSRTGKAAIYLAYRGIHVESMRDAYLIRIANNFNASLFFDVMDLWKKAEKAGAEDLLLLRFERGAIVARVLYPDRGPFKDTVYFEIYGPTLAATNEPVHNILETRALQINMPASTKTFNQDIRPEDALLLKARLTAFKARNMETELPAADKPVIGRLGDITRPLLQLVKMVSPSEEDDFRELVKEMKEDRDLEKSGSIEAKILQAVIDLKSEVNSGLLLTKTITDKYNETVNEKYQISPRRTGSRLAAMGFQKKRTPDGVAILYNKEKIEVLAEQYALKIFAGDTPADTLKNQHNVHNVHGTRNNQPSQDEHCNERYDETAQRSLNVHPTEADKHGTNEHHELNDEFSEGVCRPFTEEKNNDDGDLKEVIL